MRNLIPKSPLILFGSLYIYRLLNAFWVSTFLFPDEWWQFSEPAHVAIHGYGYLTWDWRAGIRSWVTILPVMALMWLSRVSGIGDEWMARNGGKVVMAGWMALTDFYTLKLAGKLFGPAVKPYALLFSLTSSVHASRSIRSLSNNIEMALSTVAMFYMPTTRRNESGYRAMLVVVGLACLVRITAVMFWGVPVMISWRFVTWKERLVSTPLIILVIIGCGCVVDSYFYGKLTLSWWNFYKWNIVKRVGEYYGRESIFYHVKVTLPLMVNTWAGYLVIGMWRGAWRRGWIGVTAAVFFVASSMQRHKETRFLAPLYPLILLACSYGAQQLDVSITKKRYLRVLAKIALVGVVGSQILIGWFYARVHFNGAYQVVDKLRDLVDKNRDSSVYFLTPCHVTPFQGYLHRKEVKAEFLKCHPGVVDELMPVEESEARDHFNRDPKSFVMERVIAEGYTHLVLFEGDLEGYADLITSAGYEECGRNSSILAVGSNKRRGDLLIYCKK